MQRNRAPVITATELRCLIILLSELAMPELLKAAPQGHSVDACIDPRRGEVTLSVRPPLQVQAPEAVAADPADPADPGSWDVGWDRFIKSWQLLPTAAEWARSLTVLDTAGAEEQARSTQRCAEVMELAATMEQARSLQRCAVVKMEQAKQLYAKAQELLWLLSRLQVPQPSEVGPPDTGSA